MRTRVSEYEAAGIAANRKSVHYRHDEAGSLTIFGLFMFILILCIAGMAVDLMRYESQRVGVQNALDTAIVAAASLSQEADTDEEITALVREYVSKAGYDPDIVTVDPEVQTVAGSMLSKSVRASADFRMNTMFMNLMGIDTLDGYAGGGAREGQQVIEIALVLDISGSMGWSDKLQNMKDAAKEFVTTVIDNNGSDRVMISIIPYNQQVYMTDDLRARLNLADRLVTVETPPAHPGAVTEYSIVNPASRCARFHDADFNAHRLAAGAAGIDMSGHFAEGGQGYDAPGSDDMWCGSQYPQVMLYQNDIATLHAHIDTLGAEGWTAIDYGMNWAVGVLDPSFRGVVSGMIDDALAPDVAAGHPVDFAARDVLKYIVLMTDGANTEHRDLDDPYKAGPSRVWWSEELSGGDEFDGFLVEMPHESDARRWYVPGAPYDRYDDYYLAADSLPGDAEQWTYHRIYDRFSVPDAARYFFRRSDADAYDDHSDADVDVGGYAAADTRLEAICDKAKENAWIEVYTVAFEAPEEGEAVLDYCASKDGNYFDVEGEEISVAFAAIAAEISRLRLTE